MTVEIRALVIAAAAGGGGFLRLPCTAVLGMGESIDDSTNAINEVNN